MALSPFFYNLSATSPVPFILPQMRESPRVLSLGERSISHGDNVQDKRTSAFFKLIERHLGIQRDTQSPLQFLTQNFCGVSWLSGMVASIVTENPLPFLLGLSECFPRAYAQQKVGNEFQVNTYVSSSQHYSSVASFRNGNFVVTWQSDRQDGSEYGVYGQLFDGNGTKIGNEFRANSYTTYSQASPSAASFRNGNFVVTWQSWLQDGSWGGVYGQLFDGNATKIGSDFRANTYTTDSQDSPSVEGLSNGNFVVTWQSDLQQGTSNYEIYGQLFDENATKIGNEFHVNTYRDDQQKYPSVGSLSNGNFVVTWQGSGQDGSGDGVYGQLFDGNGIKIGQEFRANTYVISAQWSPSVASFNNGNFVVTWESNSQDGSGFGIYGQLFDGNGNKIGSEFRANTYTTDSQNSPSVASFSNGNFVVTWHSFGQDGSLSGIYGQLFNGNGTKIGSEFRANTYTTDQQRYPSVASLSNGNFVVTWDSLGQDGSLSGVYGQIFNDVLITSSTDTSTTFTTSTMSTTTLASSTRLTNLTTSTTFTISTTNTVSSSCLTRSTTASLTSTPASSSPKVSSPPKRTGLIT